MTYKRYDKYKDTNVKWLGKIPEHWGISKLKYLSDIGTGDKDTINKEENGIYPFFVRSQNVEKISTYTYDGEAVLTAGDGVGVGKVFHYINGKFAFHQRVYKISDFKKVKAKFFYYYIKENFIKETEVNNAKSTVDSIRLPMIQQFPVVIPSTDEQERIVKFLDKKTLEIDSLIEEKEKLIELLKEKREAIITEAVTKGIDKNVKIKDSGVEWIGNIPIHWGISRLKFKANIIMGQSPDSKDVNQNGEGVPFLQGNADFGVINPINYKNFCSSANKYSRVDDILMSVRAPVGAINISDNIYGIGRGLCAIKSNGFKNKFLWYLLLVIREELFSKSKGSTYDSVTIDDVKNIFVIVPNLLEQESIVNYIDKKIGEIDELNNNILIEIKKLKEYRQSLISEVVTGKIDVR